MVRVGVLVTTLLCAVPTLGHAAAPHAAAGALAADELTALPGAALPAGKVLRPLRDVSYGSVGRSAAWTRFTQAAGGAWEASWDRATGVPTQIWGSGILAPGAMQSADLAALYARAWLAAHVDLLAPGAAAADFVLVANTTDGNLRAVGFAQQAGGLPVLGGQIGFEFKADRLFVIASTALPDVPIAITAAVAPRTDAVRAAALPPLRAQLGLPATARASDLGAALVVPLVAADGVLGYRVARPITLDAGATGRYLAYVDPATGAPIAARQQDMFETATVVYSGVDRYPERGRVDQPAPLAHVALDGVAQTTAHDGTVTVTGAQTLTTAVLGDLVVIHNEGTTATPATTTLPIAPDGTARWDASAVPQDDAQVVTYLAINTVKDFVRANVDAQMATLDDAITANVNIDQQCNAFFDGTAVNFFQASSKCQNTGLINDVMFHEFGHSLHENEIIAGVGAFDGAMSEGAADTLAVNITGDSGLGRGFFYTDAPLRELNPVGSEATWPADIGEIHHTGLIFGGTWWDLRATLQGELGAAAGEALTLQLYVGALRRSVDIPSSLIATLATDDDDGDLANGTPHECEIRDAYARHGLHTASGAVLGPSRIDAAFPERAIQVDIAVTGLVDRCPSDSLGDVVVQWTAGPANDPPAGSVVATQAAPGAYYAQLPLPIDGALTYNATIAFAAGSVLVLPDNRADPFYQVYQAPTVPLACTDFESGDPLQDGWTTSVGSGATAFAWSVPSGSGASDPPAAFSGTHALVQTPGSDYAPNSFASVTMPAIDVRPYSDVRLQYRRWLAVEDSQFDQAEITANDAVVWKNATANAGDSSALQHVDKEWRFQDVSLSGHFTGTKLQVGWQLTADGGLEFGGWALDDVCLVANPEAICGDGVKTFGEQCDDGAANADAPNACRTDCDLPRCGDGIVDRGEDCDAGSAGNATCSPQCLAIAIDDGGCASGGGGGGLVIGGLAFLARRRRRS